MVLHMFLIHRLRLYHAVRIDSKRRPEYLTVSFSQPEAEVTPRPSFLPRKHKESISTCEGESTPHLEEQASGI